MFDPLVALFVDRMVVDLDCRDCSIGAPVGVAVDSSGAVLNIAPARISAKCLPCSAWAVADKNSEPNMSQHLGYPPTTLQHLPQNHAHGSMGFPTPCHGIEEVVAMCWVHPCSHTLAKGNNSPPWF